MDGLHEEGQEEEWEEEEGAEQQEHPPWTLRSEVIPSTNHKQ